LIYPLEQQRSVLVRLQLECLGLIQLLAFMSFTMVFNGRNYHSHTTLNTLSLLVVVLAAWAAHTVRLLVVLVVIVRLWLVNHLVVAHQQRLHF